MRLYDPAQDPAKANAIMREAYVKMHKALLKTQRPIVYSICQYGVDAVWEWGAEVGGNPGGRQRTSVTAIEVWL